MHHLGNALGLMKIEEKTGTMMKFPKHGDYYPWARRPLVSASKVLVIAGEEQAVVDAYKMVRETLTKEAPRRTFAFLVPQRAGGLLIGADGEKIGEKTKALDVNITVRSTPLPESQVITMSDNPEAGDEVAKWILEEQKDYVEEMKNLLGNTYHGSAANVVESTIYITLDDQQVKQLIGKGGAMVQTLTKMFRVKIDVDDANKGPGNTWLVRITGLTGDIHAAHRDILERFVAPKPPKPRPRRASPKEAAALLEDAASIEEPVAEEPVAKEPPVEAAKAADAAVSDLLTGA
jgi:predicted RNA-binding protein Jag